MADMLARMRQLGGTTGEWASNDLVVGLGELAVEYVAPGYVKAKIGDGVSKFSALPYVLEPFVRRAGDTMTGALAGTTADFTGLATALSPAAADNTNKLATTAWVRALPVPASPTASNVFNQLAASVNLVTAGVFVNGPTTGPIGAAGQKWQLTGFAYVNFAAAANTVDYFTARFFDGAAGLNPSVVVAGFTGTNFFAAVSTIATLAGPTTFTLQLTNSSAGGRGQFNNASHLTAVRVA